jgi:hypothetical protein
MDSHHHGFSHIFYLKQEWKQARASLGLSGRDLVEFLYVRAGDERTAATNQHYDLYRIVLAYLLNGLGNPLGNTRAQGVHRRVIDGDNCDIFISGKLN